MQGKLDQLEEQLDWVENIKIARDYSDFITSFLYYVDNVNEERKSLINPEKFRNIIGILQRSDDLNTEEIFVISFLYYTGDNGLDENEEKAKRLLEK